jgi:hypothetical protein
MEKRRGAMSRAPRFELHVSGLSELPTAIAEWELELIAVAIEGAVQMPARPDADAKEPIDVAS